MEPAVKSELDVAHSAIGAQERRVDRLMSEMPELVAKAVREAMDDVPKLTAEEHEYIRVATRVAQQRYKLRQAVIEKTFAALTWAFIVGLGAAVWEYVKLKLGGKP